MKLDPQKPSFITISNKTLQNESRQLFLTFFSAFWEKFIVLISNGDEKVKTCPRVKRSCHSVQNWSSLSKILHWKTNKQLWVFGFSNSEKLLFISFRYKFHKEDSKIYSWTFNVCPTVLMIFIYLASVLQKYWRKTKNNFYWFIQKIIDWMKDSSFFLICFSFCRSQK